jgi:ASC-1-like (ASCH) protein
MTTAGVQRLIFTQNSMTVSVNKRKRYRNNSKTIKKSNIRKLDTPEERLTRSTKVVKKLPMWNGDTASIIL